MQENNILDDLDIHNDKIELTGTNTQLWRGLLLGIIIQFLTWVTLFKVMDSQIDLGKKAIFSIDSIGYEFNIMVIFIFLTLLIGSGSLLFFTNSKNQAYKKIIPTALFFSICSFTEVSIWRGFVNGEAWYELLVNFPIVSVMMILLQFVLLGGLLMLLKKKWMPLAILLIALVFLSVGFIR